MNAFIGNSFIGNSLPKKSQFSLSNRLKSPAKNFLALSEVYMNHVMVKRLNFRWRASDEGSGRSG